MPYYLNPLTPDDAVGLEWESLVGEIVHEGERVKTFVEERNYEAFAVHATNIRVCIDELQRRMNEERDAANLRSLSKRG